MQSSPGGARCCGQHNLDHTSQFGGGPQTMHVLLGRVIVPLLVPLMGSLLPVLAIHNAFYVAPSGPWLGLRYLSSECQALLCLCCSIVVPPHHAARDLEELVEVVLHLCTDDHACCPRQPKYAYDQPAHALSSHLLGAARPELPRVVEDGRRGVEAAHRFEGRRSECEVSAWPRCHAANGSTDGPSPPTYQQ